MQLLREGHVIEEMDGRPSSDVWAACLPLPRLLLLPY